MTIALESHVARLQASVATIAHQERPEYLDRLVVLRDQVFVLDHMYMSLFSTLRVDPAPGRDARAAGVDPPGARAARGVRAADGAHLDVAAGVERAAQERGAPANRLARHLFAIGDHRAARQGGAGHRHRRAPGRRSAAQRGSAGTGRSPRRAGARRVWHTLAWAVFGARLRRRGRVRVVGSQRAAAATCCWCWRPARGCRRTSARRSARSASCAASGWTARSGWPGSRTTRRR